METHDLRRGIDPVGSTLRPSSVGWEPYPDPGRGDAGSALNPSLEGGSKLPGGSEMQGRSLEAGGSLEQQFVEEAIVYNDRWAEKRGTVSSPKSERRTYFVCRSDGTAAEFRPESIESFNRSPRGECRHPDAYKLKGSSL